MKRDTLKIRLYMTAFLLMTAAAGNAAPALAEVVETPALGQALAISGTAEDERVSSGRSWKISSVQAEKFLSFFRVAKPQPKAAPEKKAAPHKRFDPFKAARLLMTSA